MNRLTLSATVIMPFTYSTRRFFLLIFCSLYFLFSFGQDTLRELTLDAVVVKAFEQNRNLKNVPAAVNYTGNTVLQRFSPISIVSAVNTTPGVRMEERSPGSYRVNIRGSALRSPFGVRNVKVYWNGIPITDPSGNTYFNQFAYNNFSTIEVFKGPVGSLYGAGTGGRIL